MKNKIKPFSVGVKISWKWLGRKINGIVKEVHFKPISKIIKEKNIKRNGSKENPAYLVQSDSGNLALKLHSELEPATKKNQSQSPQMFGDD